MPKLNVLLIPMFLMTGSLAVGEPAGKQRAHAGAQRDPSRSAAKLVLDEGDVCGAYSVTFVGSKQLRLRWTPPEGAHLGAEAAAACQSRSGDYRK